MKTIRSSIFCLGALLLIAPMLHAQALSKYRGFSLGTSLADVLKHSGQNLRDVKVIHARPLLIQELTWWPSSSAGPSSQPDSIEQIVFSFSIAPAPAQKHHQDYTRVNLVSDIDGVARFTDPHLVNPWGLAFSASSPFWIADNNGNVSTLYNGRGQAFPGGSPLVVNIPAPGAPTGGTPTGLVFNGTGEFSVTANGKSGSAIFLFSSEDGTFLGWTPAVDAANAVMAVLPVNAAVYKGLAIASTSKGNFIYATNFNSGWVEMYDKDFKLVKTFTDPTWTRTLHHSVFRTSMASSMSPLQSKNFRTSTMMTPAPETATSMFSIPTAP